MRSRVYITVGRPSSVCLSHRSTAAEACDGFAAERSAGRTSAPSSNCAVPLQCMGSSFDCGSSHQLRTAEFHVVSVDSFAGSGQIASVSKSSCRNRKYGDDDVQS